MRLYAPSASEVVLVRPASGQHPRVEVVGRAVRGGSGAGWWEIVDGGSGSDDDTSVGVGACYGWVVDGIGPLLDPSARQVSIIDGVPWNVHRSAWPTARPLGWHHDQPVIYEAHVRGFSAPGDGTFGGIVERIDHLVQLGVNVVELLPVHPFDPASPPAGNYWGYMPLVWGAVHEPYGRVDAAAELSALATALHEHDIELWLDVVVNHTGEGDASMPTRSLRGLVDATAYRRGPDGAYANDSGCGNDINPADPYVRQLVIEGLDRFADLGVDGFRFDLASLLARTGPALIDEITNWAERRHVVVIAEPWDMGAYLVGSEVWARRSSRPWSQWNDRFRDDVRGFVRGEPGLTPAIVRRVSGSPDVFGPGPTPTINFVTAHDGLTMHDLTIVTSDRHRSWDCGADLRSQMLRNYLTMLLLADGAAMFVMGDEFGRSQGGHDNPYNVDGPLTWVDWGLLASDEGRSLAGFVGALNAIRRSHDRTPLAFHGVDGGDVDLSHESRSLAWRTADLYVIANMWWQDLSYAVIEPPDGGRGAWVPILRTANDGAPQPLPAGVGRMQVDVPARSVVVLSAGG